MATLCTVTHAEAPNFDIGGVRFGMSAEQVRAAMRQYDPKVSISDTKTYNGETNGTPSSLAEIRGVGSTKSVGSIFVRLGQFDQKVYSISRTVAHGETMNQSVLEESLAKKYQLNVDSISSNTAFSTENDHVITWEWAYNADGSFQVGQPEPKPHKKSFVCPMPDTGRTRTGCGIAASVRMFTTRTNNVELNYQYVFSAVDHSIMYGNTKKANDATDAFKLAQTKKLDEKSKLVAPKL